MKRVAVSANTLWNIYNFRLNLLRALKKEGYEIYIIAPYDRYLDRLKEEFQNIENIFLDSKSLNPLDDIKTLWEYLKIYQKIKPHIILNYTAKPNIYSSLAGNMVGAKIINNISGLGSLFIKESFATKIAKELYQKALKNSSKVFFQNRDDLNEFLKNRIIDEKVADILPGSGVDLNRFKPTPLPQESMDGIFRFILVGRLIKDKGVMEYLRSAEILKKRYENVEFLLLGAIWKDNPTAIPKEIIENYHNRGVINYLGVTDFVDREIAKADVVVLPSYREGTPRTLLEAGAMAKPIITTDVAGCREVVDDGYNGYLCRVKDPLDLAKKMVKIFNLSESERVKMGLNSRRKIEKEFDERIVINRYIDTIKSIL